MLKYAAFFILCACTLLHAQSIHLSVVETQPPNVLSEAEHSKIFAEKYKAEREAILWDSSRVDLLTDNEAIEIDFACKWKEAVGQALYYGILTEKKPAIILIVHNKNDRDYIYRCQTVCAKYCIKLYIEKAVTK